jgi:hypothetical protein
MRVIVGIAAVLLGLTACSGDTSTDPGDTAAGTQASSASTSAGSETVGSQGDEQEALRRVVDAAVDAADLADPSLLAAVLCEPGGPQRSTRIPAGALVEIEDYPSADADEVQVNLEINQKGETSSGKLVITREGDGWCVA